MASVAHDVRRTGFAATERKDAWWVAPLTQGLLLAVLICYATWGAFQGNNYWVPHTDGGGYLSPFYSPLILVSWFPWSPALLIIGPPILFRATCYYYRKAYYRSYFLDPPACAVGELRGHGYRGETAFPLILQNLHRYLFYITFAYLFFLWYDVAEAARFGSSFGVGIGTLFILFSTSALTLYSFSCHSARHLIGGGLDCFSCSAVTRTRHAAWKQASALNEHHMFFAWMSFIGVCSADLYVRLVAAGVIHDVRLL
jgi:hypothetical protein